MLHLTLNALLQLVHDIAHRVIADTMPLCIVYKFLVAFKGQA